MFRNTLRLLTSGLGMLIIGILLIVIMGGSLIDNAKTPANYSTLKMSDIKEGMMIEGDLECNYGSYVEMSREKDNGSKTTIGYYYLIDAGEDGYMGLYTNISDLITKLDTQADATWSYLSYETDTLPSTVHFKGKVKKMDSEDIGFMKDQMESLGYEGSEIDDMSLYLYINVTDTTGHPVFFAAGIVLALLGLFFIFLFIRRKMMGR